MSANKNTMITVWDMPTRLFHWSLVIATFYSWFSVKILEDIQQHFYAGYAVLTLLLFRIIWGFIGSYHSRFHTFLLPPSNVIAYLKTLFINNKTKQKNRLTDDISYAGHNPAGGLSSVIMILVLSTQATLGLFSSDGYFHGPLTGLVNSELRVWLNSLHIDNVNIIYGLITLHLVAIAFYKWVKKEPLTNAMITGTKEVAESNRTADNSKNNQPKSNLTALVILGLCIALVYYLANAYLDLLPANEFDYF